MSVVEETIARAATGIDPGAWAALPQNPDMLNIMETLVLTLKGAATPADDVTWLYRGLPRHTVLSTVDFRTWRDNPTGSKPLGGKNAGAARPGRLYVSGGGSTYGNGFWFSDNGRDWQAVPGLVGWAPRQAHCMAWFLNRIWVFGGELPNSHAAGDVWSWGEGELEWKSESERAFAPRFGAAAVVFGNRLWMFGGTDPNNQISYTENGKDWHDAGASPAMAYRLFPQAHVIGQAVYVLGGWRGSSDISTDVMCSFDGIYWTSVQGADSPWKNGRGFGSAVQGEGADAGIVVFGGRDSANHGSADVLKFTPAPLPPA